MRWSAALALLVSAQAHAAAVAYPQGTFARPSEEKALLVWDDATKTEHLIRALSLKGDAESLGVLLATPTVPAVAKEDDTVIDRVGKLFASGAPMAADQRGPFGDFDTSTFKASDAAALDAWLGKYKLTGKASLRAWAKGYADKGWYLTGVHTTAKGTGDRKLDVPAVRLSFKTDAPVFPYTEAAVDEADEAAHRDRYNPRQPYRGYTYGTRPFELYVVAPRQMQAVSGASTAGPNVSDALRETSATVGGALGDTKAWGFDPKKRPTWVMTHLTENVWQRTTQTDLGFATYDLPKARPGPDVSETDDRPTGPTFPASSLDWLGDPVPSAPAPKKATHWGALALFLFLGAAVGFALWNEREGS